MQSSSCSSQPLKPRRFDTTRRTVAGPKSHGPGLQKEDKNMNTITTSSPRRATKAPSAPSRTRVGAQPRPPLYQSRVNSQKQASAISKSAKPKPKSGRAAAATQNAPAPAPPVLPSVLPLDPNCNEPSLPCLCCDGRSPQDNNSMFNHNHNNNNTISLRQQMQLPPPPAPVPEKQNEAGAKARSEPPSQAQRELSACKDVSVENEQKSTDLDNKKNVKLEEDDDEESSGDVDIDDDEEEADNDDDDDDDDDDDTLVPSCCDCPPSLLEFSLSSSTSSSSSTSISSCSDLESDCADQPTSICSSLDQESLSFTLSPKDRCPQQAPPARSPPSLPLSRNPFSVTSQSPIPPCSPDEGYPSALDSPSPDYLGVKGDAEVTKLGLLDFLESVGEFGKMERFSQVIQVARWDLEGEQHWDVLRDRLDHLDRLEKVNREVKLAHIARLHEKGFDLGDLEEQDLSDIMDEMGNIDIPWKLYKSRREEMEDSQEFSDAGVDLTAPSDCDDPLAPDSLTPSPAEPPPRPPKPPARHASVSSDLHTYINISRETTSMAVSTSPTPTLSTFSLNSSSPTFTTFRCEKPLPLSPPSIPPLPASKPVPYLTLYTAPSPPPAIPTPTPPIPPPRRRHLARKEAQRLAALQAEQEKTPLSLPPPTTRPPPLPPPPVISVSSMSSPPAIPPPPALPPPPSFHALDVEIRKLLMLAGLTQAELLKLSPELGVCVGGLEDEEDAGVTTRSGEPHEFRIKDRQQEKEYDTAIIVRDGWSSRSKLDGDRRVDILGEAEENKKKEESKDMQRTTSFSEMARRRKRNNGLTSEPYYSTGLSNTHELKANRLSCETLHYSAELLDSPPPPPPPRPLPPIPPCLPPPKVSTLPANSAQPERFDWLIAFTPDCEAPPQPPPQDLRKSHTEPPKKSGSSGSSPGSAPKVTTFKELRFRNKSASPPTKVITEPDPDPTVITPDPDILYNLKWRREKVGSDGNQWEYTSQAQAFFMQPPPALTSMAALKEMLQRADEEGGQLELCPSQKIGSSVSDSSLWTMGREWEYEEFKREEKEMKEEEDQEEREEEVEVRGRADGGRTFESRTTVSSPPLSLAQSSQPYFLHSALPSYRPGFCNPYPIADPRPYSHEGRTSPVKHAKTQWAPDASSACIHRDDSSTDISCGFNSESLADFGVDSFHNYENYFKPNPQLAYKHINDSKTNHIDFVSDSICNFDSLYGSDSEKQNTRSASSTPVSDTIDAPCCTTPYKNIDVMMTYSNNISAVDSLYSNSSEKRSSTDHNSNKSRTSKELPPLPTYYLYHPKNCPLHRGAPPRLSPIGALSPPQRSGVPPPGAAGSCLSSPLFPRSHTLPALAAPLYYPNLYPPVPPRAPPLPPKLYQATPQSRVATIRSVSFAGSVQRGETSWMGEDVKHPMRGLSSLCLQEKRALVSAVSVAVEAILAQFSSSRTVVQKTLSGDSTINPSLGRLVLQCLCPALHSLLTDGLKPYQSDLIAGRRPNSAWSLVQASTRPGLKTQALFNLQVRVGELPQLKQSKHRFNAFLLGLLNTKFLDFWLSHLQSSRDVLETYYHPSSFMRLSSTACQPLFEELLLLLQPLSLLTFNLDLLFQHHHLEADGHSPGIASPPCQDAGFQVSATETESMITGCKYMESLSEVDFGSPDFQAAKDVKPSPLSNPKNGEPAESPNSNAPPVKASVPLEKTSPQLLWVQEKEIGALPPPDVEEDSLTQQAGQVIQQGWGAVMRWGGRLSQNLAEMSLAAGKKEEMKTDQPDLQSQAGSDFTPVSGGAQVPWGLGRLFGASKNPNSPTGHPAPTRRPSQWLAPGVTALTRMVSSSSVPVIRRMPELHRDSDPESDKEAETLAMKDKPRPLRSVRTLCDHTGTGSELSFSKGEELVVLGGVDQDWIRCRQGDNEGLVPIGYTSLIM